MIDNRPRAYLAGPTVFSADAEALFSLQEAIVKRHGLSPVRPVEGGMLAGLRGGLLAQAIFTGNIDRIMTSDIVIADLSPFRGPSADVGTVWECAFAFAQGKLVVAWTSVPSTYAARVKEDGASVENFGLFDNLMIACALPCPPTAGFEEAVESAASLWRIR